MTYRNIAKELVILACKDLVERNKTGRWKNGVPHSIEKIGEWWFEGDMPENWLLIVEELVKNRAMEILIEEYL